MNDSIPAPADKRRHPGRLYLVLGILVTLAGPLLYAIQLQAKILSMPWYVLVLAAVGPGLLVLALVRNRTLWRWAALVLFGLVAVGEWVLFLGLVSAPDYAGPAQAGQPFPAFSATLADGSPFTQEHLKGGQNTVLVFFRGRW